ncbi:protein phnG [Aureimonas endophytica]|uniref:Protein phnG n=1 Tax=Aureimonas endophytica TaxID=2027858 RepID=A0A917E3K7_9HYPH|nr:phosphonate C-P lyase system protein PhnG [Aureimonas endophytica]GGD97808.1 protein phnG [Aureimonas endophytica]
MSERVAEDQAGRRRAMEAFAAAGTARLAAAWDRWGAGLAADLVRGPEIGLVMLRGRIGGGGAPFNLGEASVTRASVRLADGRLGHAMVLGRDAEKARLAACLDAAWQGEAERAAIEAELVAPVLAERAAARRARAEETAATKVDFFTLVRGED